MSEKEKKNAPQEEQPQANTTPETEQAAEKAAEEETFTVTREQMEQMEQLAKMVSDASDKYTDVWTAEYDNYRKRTTKERKIPTPMPRRTPSRSFWGCWITWSVALPSLTRATPTSGHGADLPAVSGSAGEVGRHPH